MTNRNMSNATFNIFRVKTVSFDQGERDPFGFDDFSEKLGAEYLPFSGSVSKPSYFLFVAYVTDILDNKLIPWKNEKQKKEIQVRLEKLLVYCWKKRDNKDKELLRGASIIGNSFDLSNIDVFSSKGWVKQNAFKIYTDRNFVPETLGLYLKRIGEKQVPILEKFMSVDVKNPEFNKDKFLEKIINELQKSEISLFKNHRLEDPSIKKKFKDEFKSKIEQKKKDVHFKIIKPFFDYKPFDNENFWKKTLDNPTLPFVHLNNWFSAFVAAVDADINNKPNKQLWNKADEIFDKIPNQFHSVSKSETPLQKRMKGMKKSKWFQYNEKEKKYDYFDRGNKIEKRRAENLWDSYKKREGEEGGKRFFNFRHYALLRLLKELQ